MSERVRLCFWLTGLLIVLIGFAVPVVAQETEDPKTEEEKAVEEALARQEFKGEITVTSRRREDSEGGTDLDSRAGDEQGPERQASALEIDRTMRDCLTNLNPPRRAAIACHLQGYSVPEAARFLGWTRKRTEHLVARGLKDLRACMLTFKNGLGFAMIDCIKRIITMPPKGTFGR